MKTLPFVLSAVVIAGCAAGARDTSTSTASTSPPAQPTASASSSTAVSPGPASAGASVTTPSESTGPVAGTSGAAPASPSVATSGASPSSPSAGASPSESTSPSAAAAGASPGAAPDTSVVGAGKPGARANAKLAPTAGNKASGSVQFVQAGSKVTVSGEIRGLKPNAEHGFHVHEKGDCSAPDATSAGGHFNPDGKPHGKFGEGTHHRGDLQSLKADGSGVAKFEFDAESIGIGSGPADILGKGLIVHADPDDFKTQPTGNSGARLACAVISKG